MKQIAVLLFTVLLLQNNASYGQEHRNIKDTAVSLLEHDYSKNHRITLALGHTRIRRAVEKGESTPGVSLPSWIVDYDYWLNNFWAVGFHGDIILDNFMVEAHLNNEENLILHRSFPVALAPVVLYRPWKNIVLETGLGAELSPEENAALFRFGGEYGIHLPHAWELSCSATYDMKIKNYDSWTIGIGVSKWLNKHHHRHS